MPASTAPVDDVAVTGYCLYQDGVVLISLDAQARGHSLSNLIVGRKYEFRVEAGDAQDQWSTDGPRLRIATNLVPNDVNSSHTVFSGDHTFSQYWHADIFVRDRAAGLTERVSLRDGGFQTAVAGSSS